MKLTEIVFFTDSFPFLSGGSFLLLITLGIYN